MEQIFTVYAMVSEVDGRIYVGFSSDISRRMKEHNSGQTTSTKFYRQWKLFYTEKLTGRANARRREIYLKGGSGKEFLKQILLHSSTDRILAGRQGFPWDHDQSSLSKIDRDLM